MIHTPIESYHIESFSFPILVKREDLCGGKGSPPFSKIRGLYSHLSKLKSKGIRVVGYTETAVSMAGWGVAWACQQLKMRAVIFDPQYKKTTPAPLLIHREQWKRFGAIVEPIPSGMAAVGWYVSRKILQEKYGPKAVLLPLGLPFPETVEETAVEFCYTLEDQKTNPSVVVINIGSGTVAAGIVKGIHQSGKGIKTYGIMGRTGSVQKKRSTIFQKSGVPEKSGLLNFSVPLQIIDPGWEYTEKSEVQTPFPSHPYYDVKAWEWLLGEGASILKKEQILFWNIGSFPS